MIDNHILSILTPFAFVLGMAIGSFVTMASYRMPRDEEMVFKPSHCTHCGATLKAIDLIPLLSWLIQRGRCRHCHAKVSIRYPLIELSLGIAFLLIMMTHGLSFTTLLLMLLVTELAIMIVTDLEHTIIPDSVQIALFLTGVAWCVLHHAAWANVAISASFGLALGLSLHYGFKWIYKKDGLGWADVKFLCIAGIWLSFTSFVPFLFFAGILGTMTGLIWRFTAKGPVFPFGPALALSLLINVLWPDLLQQMIGQF